MNLEGQQCSAYNIDDMHDNNVNALSMYKMPDSNLDAVSSNVRTLAGLHQT